MSAASKDAISAQIRRDTKFSTAIVGLVIAAMMDAAHAAQASLRPPKSGRLIVSPENKISLDLRQGDVKGRVISDNKIQLKFGAEDPHAELV